MNRSIRALIAGMLMSALILVMGSCGTAVSGTGHALETSPNIAAQAPTVVADIGEAGSMAESGQADFPHPADSRLSASGHELTIRTTDVKEAGLFHVMQLCAKGGSETSSATATVVDMTVADGVVTLSVPLAGSSGTIRRFNAKHKLIASKLKRGALPTEGILFIETGEETLIIGQPRIYVDLGSATCNDVTDPAPPVWRAVREDEGWSLQAVFRQLQEVVLSGDKPNIPHEDTSGDTSELASGEPDGTFDASAPFGILWMMRVPSGTPDFNDPDTLALWSTLDLDRNARLTTDGYLYRSPSTYNPSTQQSFWRNPSVYLAPKLLDVPGDKAARVLAQALLQLAAEHLEADGTFPTWPESTWLQTDFGIGGGLYDTRFNADALENNLRAAGAFGDFGYWQIARALADSYVAHAEANHFNVWTVPDPLLDLIPEPHRSAAAKSTPTRVESSLSNGSNFSGDSNFSNSCEISVDNDATEDAAVGWLVQDYGQPGARPTHCSLNHQLQAVHAFLMLYEHGGSLSDLRFAMKLLQGVRVTQTRWIRDDGNLEYAWMPDGTMGLTDYPYLTYNDLFEVQADLVRITGKRDASLDCLMESKLGWMMKNGIIGYKSEDAALQN